MGWIQKEGYGKWGIYNNAAASSTTVISIGNSQSAVLVQPRPSRKFVDIYNDAGILLVKLGDGVSESSYGYKVPSKGLLTIEHYDGQVTAIKAPGQGISQVAITEGY